MNRRDVILDVLLLVLVSAFALGLAPSVLGHSGHSLSAVSTNQTMVQGETTSVAPVSHHVAPVTLSVPSPTTSASAEPQFPLIILGIVAGVVLGASLFVFFHRKGRGGVGRIGTCFILVGLVMLIAFSPGPRVFAIPSTDVNVELGTWASPCANPCSLGEIMFDSLGSVYVMAMSQGTTSPTNVTIIRLAVQMPPPPSGYALRTWTLPIQSSFSAPHGAIDSSSNVYFTVRDSNQIVRLNPSTNTITEWVVPTTSAGVGYVTVDSSGNVYFTEYTASKIGRLVPSTNTITEWPNLGPGGMVKVDLTGNVYFAGSNDIDKLVPSSNSLTRWVIPTSNSVPEGVAVDSSGTVYFTEYTASKIGRLVPVTNMITEWMIPTAASSPKYIAIDSLGVVYFTETNAMKVGRLVPSTNTITEWTIPTSLALGGITVGASDYVYFTETDPEAICRLTQEY